MRFAGQESAIGALALALSERTLDVLAWWDNDETLPAGRGLHPVGAAPQDP